MRGTVILGLGPWLWAGLYCALTAVSFAAEAPKPVHVEDIDTLQIRLPAPALHDESTTLDPSAFKKPDMEQMAVYFTSDHPEGLHPMKMLELQKEREDKGLPPARLCWIDFKKPLGEVVQKGVVAPRNVRFSKPRANGPFIIAVAQGESEIVNTIGCSYPGTTPSPKVESLATFLKGFGAEGALARVIPSAIGQVASH